MVGGWTFVHEHTFICHTSTRPRYEVTWTKPIPNMVRYAAKIRVNTGKGYYVAGTKLWIGPHFLLDKHNPEGYCLKERGLV
jgi:hypothetical protein